jgi:hypothetical protein
VTCHQFPDADDREHLLAELAACRNEIRSLRERNLAYARDLLALREDNATLKDELRMRAGRELSALTALGVDHIQLRAVEAGGRWQADGEWIGHVPGQPRTGATETSGHFERLGSLGAVVVAIAEQAGETP